MSKSRRLSRRARRVTKYFISALFIFMLLLSWLCGFIKFSLIDTGHLKHTIMNQHYLDEVSKKIDDTLQFECMYLGIPSEEIIAAVDRNETERLAEAYVDSVIHTLLFNDEPVSPQYDPALLRPTVENLLREQSFSEADLATHSQNIAEYLAAYISNCTNVIDADLLGALPKMESLKHLLITLSDLFFVLLCLDIVFMIALFLIIQKDILAWLFNFATVFWLSTACVFIPAWALKFSDISDRLILSYSTLRLFVVNTITGLTDQIFFPALICFVPATLALGVALYCHVARQMQLHPADLSDRRPPANPSAAAARKQ